MAKKSTMVIGPKMNLYPETLSTHIYVRGFSPTKKKISFVECEQKKKSGSPSSPTEWKDMSNKELEKKRKRTVDNWWSYQFYVFRSIIKCTSILSIR